MDSGTVESGQGAPPRQSNKRLQQTQAQVCLNKQIINFLGRWSGWNNES